jgi:hypothetical protein
MVERSDVVLAVIPVLALAGPLLARVAWMFESTMGVGAGVARLPLTPIGLLAALVVIVGAMFALPTEQRA